LSLFSRFQLRLDGRERAWLSAGFLLALSSSFGQTFFIALFSEPLRQEFGLTPGDFGEIYTLGTGASAITLIWLGRLADRARLAPVILAVTLVLVLACLGMAFVASAVMLGFVIYLLRVFGQGMMSHLYVTASVLWFGNRRGKALSIAALGHPFGEAILPSLAVASMVWIGWRETWMVCAGLLLLGTVPLVAYLLRDEPGRRPKATAESAAAAPLPKDPERQWTRGEVLRDPLFYCLMTGVLAPSFMMTGIFFHQSVLVNQKGWDLAWFAATYPFYAVVVVFVSLLSGWAADRWSARRIFPLYLLPMGLAILALGLWQPAMTAVVFMVLSGATVGMSFTLSGTLWAELYGTKNLGGVRALAVGAMVASTALAPGAMGWMIDAGISLDEQLRAMAYYTFAVTGFFVLLSRRHPRLHAAGAV